MREALATNLDLASADRKVAAGLGTVGNARANLLPQVNIGNRAIVIDGDRADAGFGNNPEQAVFATGNFRQLIYSDKAWANYTVQQRTQDSRVAERREVQLNTAREAGVAYLNVLRTKTVERIQKENLRLTRSNLELARVREAVGAAARDEVFRWESEIANGRIEVLDAQAQRQQAGVSLNRILYRPLEEPFVTNEAGLDDPLLFADQERLFLYINNPRNFQVFRDFEVNEGLRVAPEIHRIDALIAAQDRTLLNADRTFWAPEVALSSEVSQRYAQGGSRARWDCRAGRDRPGGPSTRPDDFCARTRGDVPVVCWWVQGCHTTRSRRNFKTTETRSRSERGADRRTYSIGHVPGWCFCPNDSTIS